MRLCCAIFLGFWRCSLNSNDVSRFPRLFGLRQNASVFKALRTFELFISLARNSNRRRCTVFRVSKKAHYFFSRVNISWLTLEKRKRFSFGENSALMNWCRFTFRDFVQSGTSLNIVDLRCASYKPERDS